MMELMEILFALLAGGLGWWWLWGRKRKVEYRTINEIRAAKGYPPLEDDKQGDKGVTWRGAEVVLTPQMIQAERDRTEKAFIEKEKEHLVELEKRRGTRRKPASQPTAKPTNEPRRRRADDDDIPLGTLGVLAALDILGHDHHPSSHEEPADTFKPGGGEMGGGGASGGWEDSKVDAEPVESSVDTGGDAGGSMDSGGGNE